MAENLRISPYSEASRHIQSFLEASPEAAVAFRPLVKTGPDGKPTLAPDYRWDTLRADRYIFHHHVVWEKSPEGIDVVVKEKIRMECPNAVVALPYRWNPDKRRMEVFTTRQERAFTTDTVSLPMGHQNVNETPILIVPGMNRNTARRLLQSSDSETLMETALREVYEETELTPLEAEQIYVLDRDPVISDAEVHVFAVRVKYEPTQSASRVQEENENISADAWRSWEQFSEFIKQERPRNPWVVSAIFAMNLWRDEKIADYKKQKKEHRIEKAKEIVNFVTRRNKKIA